jgi:ABC-type multidrug transport system fused ATPase/permease subunit
LNENLKGASAVRSPILSFENVTYKYADGTIALKDISLSIEHGEEDCLNRQ